MCCGRTGGSKSTPGQQVEPGDNSTGGPTTYTVTTATGDTVIKSSRIAARLYVAANPGSTYTETSG